MAFGSARASRARRDRDQAVDLGDELDVVAPRGIARKIERPAVRVQPGGHEDVERIVDVLGTQAEWRDGPCQIVLTVGHARAAVHDLVVARVATAE